MSFGAPGQFSLSYLSSHKLFPFIEEHFADRAEAAAAAQ